MAGLRQQGAAPVVGAAWAAGAFVFRRGPLLPVCVFACGYFDQSRFVPFLLVLWTL